MKAISSMGSCDRKWAMFLHTIQAVRMKVRLQLRLKVNRAPNYKHKPLPLTALVDSLESQLWSYWSSYMVTRNMIDQKSNRRTGGSVINKGTSSDYITKHGMCT